MVSRHCQWARLFSLLRRTAMNAPGSAQPSFVDHPALTLRSRLVPLGSEYGCVSDLAALPCLALQAYRGRQWAYGSIGYVSDSNGSVTNMTV